MLKQLTVTMTGMLLGVAVLAVSTVPATADRGKTRWVEPTPGYAYDVKPQKRGKAVTQRQKKPSFEETLDFETEAVWRNLRPNRFDDY